MSPYTGLLLSTSVVALHAKFDQYLGKPVHIPLPFVTTGPDTDSASTGNMKLLN